MLDITLVIIAYLLGSISSAIIVARLLGLPDPRSQGSGNPGATNMMRLGGKGAAVVTLLGDMLKGVLPVLLARALGGSELALAGAAAAAFLGHLYPVFFGFQGGKGVATLFGTLLGLNWLVGVMVLGTWLADGVPVSLLLTGGADRQCAGTGVSRLAATGAGFHHCRVRHGRAAVLAASQQYRQADGGDGGEDWGEVRRAVGWGEASFAEPQPMHSSLTQRLGSARRQSRNRYCRG